MSTIKCNKIENTTTSTGGISVDSAGDVQVSTNFEVATIKDTSGNNSSTPQQINQGRAKAWIVFDGTSASIGTGEDSFNVSGVTDLGTGNYRITFSNDLPSANYVVTGMVANTDDGFSTSVAGATRGCSGVHIQGTVAPTASQFNIQTRFGSTSGSNGNADDFSRVYIAVFGD